MRLSHSAPNLTVYRKRVTSGSRAPPGPGPGRAERTASRRDAVVDAGLSLLTGQVAQALPRRGVVEDARLYVEAMPSPTQAERQQLQLLYRALQIVLCPDHQC